MEASKLDGAQAEGGQSSRPLSLSTAIIEAVSEIIHHARGKESPPARQLAEMPEEPDPSQLAMAVAYTNLWLEDPEMVTSRHLKMLRSAFSYEQIQELNELIKKMLP